MSLSIIFIVGLNSIAYTDKGDAIYVYSQEIPDEVNVFALNTANSLSPELYKALDIKAVDTCDLKLMQGFTPYEYDNCERQVYYFPIQGSGRIIAMLKIVDNGNNDYSVQIERTDIEAYLNSLSNTSDDPLVLVISDEYLYFLDSRNNYTQVEVFWACYEEVDSCEDELPNLAYSDITFNDGVVVEISERTSSSLSNARDLPSAVSLYVPFVSNYSNSDYPAGVCWASAAASLIKYRLSTSSSADSIRDAIVAYGYNIASNHVTDSMKSAMEGYLSITMTKTTTLSFSSVQSILNSDKPIWSLWTRSGGGHCLVIRNYSINSSGTKYFGFMDCNKTYYTVMVYGHSFTNGTYVYTWQTSVY
jgi:hypothetical protein